MRIRDGFRWSMLALFVAVSASACARRDPFHGTAVTAEIARLDGIQRGIEKNPPAGFATLVPHHREALTKASSASDAALRLYRLRDPFVGIETLSYVSNHSAAATDLAAFERLWGTERDAIARAATPAGSMLQRALAEGARNRAQVLYRASLPFARTSSPADGLYYLAEAVANRRFSEFIQSRGGETSEGAPSRDAVQAGLDKLDAEMLRAFEHEPTGKTTIPASALSKESHELLRRGWTDGAALVFLEARISLSKRTRTETPDTPLQPGRGDSMSALISALAKESDPAVARIVRAEVAPAYAALFNPVPRATTASGPVTITLVRWPYT